VAPGVIALVAAVFVGGVYAFAWWRASQAVDAELERWASLFAIERGPVVLGPTGRIGVRDLVLRAAGSAPDGASVRIGQAIFDGGGGFGTFGRLLAGASRPSSGSFRMILRDVSLRPAPNAAPLGLGDRFVLFPFDLAGCGAGDSLRITSIPGLSRGALDGELVVERKGEAAEVRLRGTSHGIADLALELRIDELGGGSWPSALRTARLRGARFDVVDHGFAQGRNRHCAAVLGVDEATAIDRHLDGVRAWFAARHAEPAAPLLAVYRRLAERGGTLEVNLRPRRPIRLVEFADMPLRDFSLHFGGTARVEGLVPATLALTPLAMPERERTQPAAIDAPLVALSAAAEVAGAKPGDPVPAAMRFAPGQRLAYEDLESLVGATLAVTSDLGMTRRGRLERYTRAGIEIQLDAADGGFRLTMPRDSVRSIVLVANPPLEPAAPARN
jgi:hypothetical protein